MMLSWPPDFYQQQYSPEELRDAQEELLAGGAPPALLHNHTGSIWIGRHCSTQPTAPPPPPSISLSQLPPIPGLWQVVRGVLHQLGIKEPLFILGMHPAFAYGNAHCSSLYQLIVGIVVIVLYSLYCTHCIVLTVLYSLSLYCSHCIVVIVL